MVGAEHSFGSTPPACNAWTETEGPMEANNPSPVLARLRMSADDVLYQRIVYRALSACEGWAWTELDPGLDLLLRPRERGPAELQQVPYRVTQKVVERGVWRVTLCPADLLPAGAALATREQVLRAQIARSVGQLGAAAVDQVVQCGLFGEVLY